MKICNKCILPETFPDISFDANGVCNYCNKNTEKRIDGNGAVYETENDVKQALERYRTHNNKYDVLVPVSGGVDSCYTLIKIVRDFNLTPLVFHNDHGFECEGATENVRKLCKVLNVDLMIYQHDYEFMKKLWRYMFASDNKSLKTCYVCGNVLFNNSIEMADRFNIKLLINGYSKGQITDYFLKDGDMGRKQIMEMMRFSLRTDDKAFARKFQDKFTILNKLKICLTKESIEQGILPDQISYIPFYLFKFHRTDKEVLKRECRKIFDWKPLEYSYPGRTTNCMVNWLNIYHELKQDSYNVYHPEYASLVRTGEMTREQALADLDFNPPEGLIAYLKKEIELA